MRWAGGKGLDHTLMHKPNKNKIIIKAAERGFKKHVGRRGYKAKHRGRERNVGLEQEGKTCMVHIPGGQGAASP